jgi:hypothetical protein
MYFFGHLNLSVYLYQLLNSILSGCEE